MSFIAYPENLLPPPQTGPFVRVQATVASSVGKGVILFAMKELAFRGVQDVSFLFSAEQSIAFRDFWLTTLNRGGSVFTTRWPLPSGWFNPLGLRKFVTVPKWQHIGGGAWNVSATTELTAIQLPIYPTFTTPPYPVTNIDELEIVTEISHNPAIGLIEDLDIALSILSGIMAVKLRVIYPVDDFESGESVLSGTLQTFTFGSYDIPFENIESGESVFSGVLRLALINYTVPFEEIESGQSVLSGTLV